MKILCPNKSLFSNKIILKLKKRFKCLFENLNQKQFDKICHDYEIIFLRFTLNLKYKKNTKIKYIISPTTGLNHIDKHFFEKKYKIFYLKNKSFLKKINSTSEHTIFLILNLLKARNYKLKFGYKKNYTQYISLELSCKTIGIIGNGRIGKKVSKILKSFGCKILIYDKYKKNKNNVSLSALLKNADIISLHIPLNNNYNFFNSEKFKLMKKNSILINTSRGEIIDQKALIYFFNKKKLSIALDVLSDENEQQDASTLKIIKFSQIYKNRCFITPHIAGLSDYSIEMTDDHVITNFLKRIKIYEKPF
jgi:D-3-phosphoglycerate dehydrogenase